MREAGICAAGIKTAGAGMFRRFSNKRVYLGQFYRMRHPALRLAAGRSTPARRGYSRHESRTVWRIAAWAFAAAVLITLAAFGGVGLDQPRHLPVGMVLTG